VARRRARSSRCGRGAGAFVVGNKVAAQAVPVKLSRSETQKRIGDERSGYGVATTQDVLVYRRLYAERMQGTRLRPRNYVVRPQISGGNWIFRCPDCGQSHASLATPGLETVVCSTCSGEFPARFPDDREEIERLLLARPNEAERNWQPGQSPAELRRLHEDADQQATN
jgi:hypothetical protein